MTINHFTRQDQQTVSEFWTAIWMEMSWDDEIEGNDDIPKFLHFPQGFLLVVKASEKIVGCAGVKPLTDSVGVVKRFYLDASLRGSGFAKTLLQRIIHESKRKGFSKLVLDVYYSNLRAKHFYEKNGFTPYAQEPVALWEESKFPKEFFFYQLPLDS